MKKSLKIVVMDQETRLKRLKYRSWHRGCKETDIILGRFSEARMERLPADTLDLYEQLLDENDVDIWNWLSGAEEPTNADYIPLLDMLKQGMTEALNA